MLGGSDRLNETTNDGGVHALLSTNDDAFVGAATIANGLHQQAVMLFRDRSVPSGRRHSRRADRPLRGMRRGA